MQQRISPARGLSSRQTCFFLLASLLFSPAALLSPAAAQSREFVRIPAAALPDQAELDRLLQRGEALEDQHRWGDALTHYEEASKSYPDRRVFRERRTLSRMHYDLGRRYSDGTFIATLREYDKQQALRLYSEILLKIHTHYVVVPDWKEIVRLGAVNLDIALSEKKFIKENIPRANSSQIENFRLEIYNILGKHRITNRLEAQKSISALAGRASVRLGLPPQATILECLCGAINSLDPYSSYLTRGQLEDVMSQIEGNFVGLGIELKSEDHALLIVDVIKGGPADKGGLKAGDRITAVDGHSLKKISSNAGADMLKGLENSTVEVAVVTSQGRSHRLTLTRQVVAIPSIEDAQIIDSEYGVAYFRLASFQKSTSRDIDSVLWKLHREGMKSLIVDVRGNPGGLLSASVDAADKFLARGTIVSTRGRSPREDFDYKAHEVGVWRIPLVVLIDGDTASASEIFAGAICDHRRGKVVGQRSYGKGSVQGIFPLNTSKAGVRLTTAKFFSPSGKPISRRGVQPDVVVRSAAKPVSGENRSLLDDPVLKAGLQTVRNSLTRREAN